MLIAFGITATFKPCLMEPPAAPLLDDDAPAEPALLEDEDELPHAVSATAAASTGIQRMPLMRMMLLLATIRRQPRRRRGTDGRQGWCGGAVRRPVRSGGRPDLRGWTPPAGRDGHHDRRDDHPGQEHAAGGDRQGVALDGEELQQRADRAEEEHGRGHTPDRADPTEDRHSPEERGGDDGELEAEGPVRTGARGPEAVDDAGE